MRKHNSPQSAVPIPVSASAGNMAHGQTRKAAKPQITQGVARRPDFRATRFATTSNAAENSRDTMSIEREPPGDVPPAHPRKPMQPRSARRALLVSSQQSALIATPGAYSY